MTREEVRQAEMMLTTFQGEAEAKVTTTSDQWIGGNSLGPFFPRREAALR